MYTGEKDFKTYVEMGNTGMPDSKRTPKAWLQCYKHVQKTSSIEIVRKYSSKQQGHASQENNTKPFRIEVSTNDE